MSKQALTHFTWIYFYSIVLIAPLVQTITVHGFNGDSSTENTGAHDLSGNLGLAVIRACKELHAGICRSYCLATELEGGLICPRSRKYGCCFQKCWIPLEVKVIYAFETLSAMWKPCSSHQYDSDPELACLGLTFNIHSWIAPKHPWVVSMQEIGMAHGMLACTLGNFTVSLLSHWKLGKRKFWDS